MRWMWIDTITAYEPERRLSAIKNVSLAEEHLHDHFAASEGIDARPVMPASLIIEGMAQTAGILVGAARRFTEKVILAKVAVAEFEADVFPGQTIRYDAELSRIDDAGAATSGIVHRLDHGMDHRVDHSSAGPPVAGDEREAGGRWEPIGRVDLMFSHIDRNLAGIEFPSENFVFSDNFRTILRAAGLGDLAEA